MNDFTPLTGAPARPDQDQLPRQWNFSSQKKENEVLPLIFVNVLFLATQEPLWKKEYSGSEIIQDPFVIGVARQLHSAFTTCCFSIVNRARRKTTSAPGQCSQGRLI